MFKYTFQRPDLALMIQSAVEKALNDGVKTLDIGGKATGEQMTKAIEESLTK